MTFFDVVSLAGGLALFLYGMSIMGSGLEKLAGGKLEGVLQKLTSNTMKSVGLGAGITALIQSSSATTVILIGLVNSGIMQLSQAIGVIMGANIGTTVTGQLLRLSDISGDSFWLQLFKPSTLAPAIAFVGMLFYVFFKSQKKRNIGQILLGFGILFTGMFAIEGAVAPLRESPWFAQLFTSLQNPLLGILAGTLITAVIQSSSASVGILQALTTTGLVTWSSAIPIILGQNIGTCSTGLIASVGASKSAKRVAVVHLYFNIIGSLLFMGVIYAIQYTVGFSFWDNTMNKGDIANFHTLFNLVSTLIFLPFTKLLARLAEWTVRDKPEDEHEELKLTVLDERLYNSPAVAVQQAQKAVLQMATNARLNQRDALGLLLDYDQKKVDLANEREDVVDKLDVRVSNYLVKMNDLDLSEEESRQVTLLLNYVTEFERIGDYAVNVIERGGEVYDKKIVFSQTARFELQVLHDAVGEILDLAIEVYEDGNFMAAGRVEPLEETVDLICEILRERHISRLKNGLCNIEAGIVFLSVLTDYERISDHCSNIAARMLSEDSKTGHFNTHELRRNMHEGQLSQYNNLLEEYNQKYIPQLSDEANGEEGEACYYTVAEEKE